MATNESDPEATVIFLLVMAVPVLLMAGICALCRILDGENPGDRGFGLIYLVFVAGGMTGVVKAILMIQGMQQ